MELKQLLGIDSNPKTVKGQAKGFMTAILYLSPSDLSGVMNVCPFASKGCRDACLNSAGRGRFDKIQTARRNRTIFFKSNRQRFLEVIVKDIERLIKKAEKLDLIPVVRLNGTSDIDFHKLKLSNGLTLLEMFPTIQFYDYTKSPKKALDFANGLLPVNYHITFSLNESNKTWAKVIAKAGGNIAVVFKGKNIPKTFMGLKVVDGDESDLRFLDGTGKVAALKAKGKAIKDTSGFVIQTRKGWGGKVA